jgi:Na+/proline symporter/signal transduction histidine kinase
MLNLGATGLGLIDYGIFFAALLAVLVVGLWSGGKIKSLEDYAVSRKHKFSSPILAMTLIATMIGSESSVVAIAEIHKDGIIYLLHGLGLAVGAFLLIQYAAKFMARRYADAISLYGIVEQEYGRWPAKFSASISTFIALVVLSTQMIGMGYISKTFLGLPFHLGVLGTSVIFILYSSFSGIRGVVYTDVVQFLIVLFIFPILVGIVAYKLGGLQFVFTSLPASKLQIGGHPDIKEYSFLTLFWMMPFSLLYPDMIQRILMCQDSKELQKMGFSWVVFKVTFLFLVAIIGLASVSLLPPEVAGKEVIPSIMKDFLPIGIKGLAITAFLALIMSTADSLLNAATVLVAEVYMSQSEREERDRNDFRLELEGKLDEAEKKKRKKNENLWLKITSLSLGGLAMSFALLDFSFIKGLTIASAIAFAAVNIPIFFAPFKDRRQKAVKAYLGSALSGFGAFLILWAVLGQERIYMVSFFATFFAIAGWFIGANFFDKIKTTFWSSLRKAYAPKFNVRGLLEASRGYEYFVVFGILTFLLRYVLEVWRPFSEGYIIISALFTICCLLLLSLYFGEKIKNRNYQLFLTLWLIAMFLSLPLYNMIALLQDPDSAINLVGLVVAVLIMNVMLSWRLSLVMFVLAFAISTYLNYEFFQQRHIFSGFEYLSLISYVITAGIIITMILRKTQDNLALEKLEYADAMACSIAHELKSPIAHSGILLRGTKVRTMEDVETLIQRMDKVQRKTSDVISRTVQLFTQGTSSDVTDEDVNIANLLMMVLVGTNYPRKYRDRIKINVAADFVVRAYSNNLFTIVDNLVRNAYKYALVKKETAHLEIYTEGNQLIFRDTGPGISSDRLVTIFDKGVSYNPTGTGFGLYYCKIEMERLGGSINCQSKEGEFTKFTLVFPKKGKKRNKIEDVMEE